MPSGSGSGFSMCPVFLAAYVVIISIINDHITKNNLHEPLQSAYTSNHSTEIALLKVSDDILCALDNGKCIFMVLLDFCAAFNTIDHAVFLAGMKDDYGMSGCVAGWMQSYLSNRHQSISINDSSQQNVLVSHRDRP